MKVLLAVPGLCFALALPSLGGDASRAKPADIHAQAEALVKPLFEKKQSVGVVIGVLEGDKTRVFGFGRTALEVDKTPDAKTIFEIGSGTKVFTSLALAQLAQEGLLHIDDPVEQYLPADVKVATRAGRAITLEDLATHTSGLPRLPVKLLFGGLASGNPYANYRDKDLYDFLKEWKPKQDIGSKWDYSNVGVGLLGHALARCAGVDYEQLIANRITEPLGMNDTRIKLTADQEKRLAKPYAFGNKPAARWTFDVLAGCGALNSTVDDMLIFLTAELGVKDSKLRPAMELTQKPRRDGPAKGTRMGLGWLITKLPKDSGERELYWHNGGTGGFSSFVGFIKEPKIAVVVLANGGPSLGSLGAVDAVGLRILKTLIPKAPN